MTERGRLEYLDAVRGLAIAMVFVNHAGSLVNIGGGGRSRRGATCIRCTALFRD